MLSGVELWIKSRVARRPFVQAVTLRRERASGRRVRRAGVDRGEKHLLGALLLGEHFLLLLDDLCLVLEGEGEGEADEEGRGGDYPDDVSDDPAGFLDKGCGAGEGRGDGVSGGGGHDVDEGGETVVEGLVWDGLVGGDGGERVGRVCAGRGGGRVGGVVLVDDLDLDHGERGKPVWRCCGGVGDAKRCGADIETPPGCANGRGCSRRGNFGDKYLAKCSPWIMRPGVL